MKLCSALKTLPVKFLTSSHWKVEYMAISLNVGCLVNALTNRVQQNWHYEIAKATGFSQDAFSS